MNVPPSMSSQRQLALAGAADEVGPGAGDLLDRPAVGVADHRHDEAVRGRDRDADVGGGMTVDLVAAERRVDGAVAHERDADELASGGR